MFLEDASRPKFGCDEEQKGDEQEDVKTLALDEVGERESLLPMVLKVEAIVAYHYQKGGDREQHGHYDDEDRDEVF